MRVIVTAIATLLPVKSSQDSATELDLLFDIINK